MLTLTRRFHPNGMPAPQAGALVLPFEQRCKSRFRAQLEDGREVGVLLPRGTVLRGGDLLADEDGTHVCVIAATEQTSIAFSGDELLLTRAAYHLGNRHVPLELGDGWLRYLHDHVLDAMLIGMGLHVRAEYAAFEPEAGAYEHHGAAPGHAHSHA